MIERCVRFTTIPLNSYQIQHELDILNFVVENWLFLFVCFLEKQKLSCKLYLQHYWSDFQVSRYHPCESSLNGGSLKITPTVPLLLRLDQWLIDKKDMKWLTELSDCWMVSNSEAEFKEFKPRPWFTKNLFKLSTGSNTETLNTISSGTNHVWASSQIWEAAQIL